MSALFSWVLAASSLLAPTRQHDTLAEAISTRAEAEPPLFRGDEDRRKTSAFLVAIAFRESSLRANAVGDHVGGKPTSFCAFQLHLPWGRKTAEGWTSADLIEDPEKCVTAAMRMIRESMRGCPAHPLALYAAGPGGCENARAQRISRDRLAIAQRLLREAHVPESDVFEKPATITSSLAPDVDRPRRPFSPETVAIRPAAARPRHFCGGA